MKPRIIEEDSKWEVFDYFNEAYYAISYEDIFLFANPSACNFWGKKKEDIVGRHVDLVFPQAKGTVLEEKRKESQLSGRPQISEFYFPSPPYEGWYEITHTPCLEGVIARFKPIQEKKKASESIDFLYELISLMLKQLQEPVVILDLRFMIKESNNFLLTFAGIASKSKIIGKDFFQTFCVGKKEELKPVFDEVFRHNRSKVASCGDLKMTISTILDYFGHPLYYIIFMNKKEDQGSKPDLHLLDNSSLSKTTEKVPQDSHRQNFYHDLWNQSGVPTAIFDTKGDLQNVNQAMNELFSNQINPTYNLLNDPSLTWETRSKIKANQVIHAEKYFGSSEAGFFFLNKTGAIKKEYYLEVLIKPFYADRERELKGYTLRIIDHLKGWKKEEQRSQMHGHILEQVKASTELFASTISSLLLFVKDAEDKKFLTRSIKTQKLVLKSLIQEISVFQQLGNNNEEVHPIPLHDLIQQIAEECQEKHKEQEIKIIVALGDIPPIQVDIVRTTQVFHNICEIVVDDMKTKEINITTKAGKDNVRVLFEVSHLSQKKYQKAVQNLEICQKIIQLQKASFEFEWNDNGTFTCQIEFPQLKP